MPISTYPRRGQRIAPAALREVLNVPLSLYLIHVGELPADIQICDLDETVWDKISEEDADALADIVIHQTRLSLSELLEICGDNRLPNFADDTCLDDLHLLNRTYDCLVKSGRASATTGIGYNLRPLHFETIRSLLHIQNFGLKSLVDLLTSLESHQISAPQETLVEQIYVEQNPESETLQHNPYLGILLAELCEQTDALHEAAHALAANAHTGLDFQIAAGQLEAMRHAAGVLQRDITRWEDVCAQCERPFLNAELSLAVSEIKNFISELPIAGEIRCDDPRLHDFTRPIFEISGDAKNLAEVIAKLSQRARDPISPETCAAHLQTLLRQLQELSALSFEEELQQFFDLATPKNADERKKEIARRRFGLDGRGGATLQLLASEVGVSRERIRQMVGPHETVLERLAIKKPFAPLVDRVLTSRTPCSLSDKSLKAWAKFLGRQNAFEVFESGFDKLNAARASVLELAIKGVRRWGVVSIEELSQRLQPSSIDNDPGRFEDFDVSELSAFLELQPHFHWLDEEQNWFWFSDLERGGKNWNALLTQIKKVFAVTNRIHVMELRAGVSRHHRREGFAPPRKVLLELCRQLPWLQVENEEIFLTDESQIADALSFSETIFYHALRANDSAATRRELERECSTRGMNEATFTMQLGASPIIVRHASSVYGLRGALVEPGKIEEMISQVERGHKGRARVLQDYGWKDGDIWIGYKVSSGALNGVCSIPSGLKNFFNGEFCLQTFDGAPAGTLACGENQAWGIGPFMKRRGAEAGDYLLLRLDLQNRMARIALGDESLLDDYQTSTAPEA